MPTYEYQCTKCEQVFEEFQSITARPLRKLRVDCKQCSNKAPVKRLIGTGAALLFKGDGFYETDYRSESYKKAAKADFKAAKGPASSDKKSDKKTTPASESKSTPKKKTSGD